MSMTEMRFPGENAQRRRITIGQNGTKAPTIEQIEPMSEDIAKDAARFHTMVQNIIKDRNEIGDKLNQALARIEQFQSAETRMISELEGERARTAAALSDAEAARTRQAQLETVIHSMVNMGTDALPQ